MKKAQQIIKTSKNHKSDFLYISLKLVIFLISLTFLIEIAI
jgi:hypothetical protein